MTRVGIYVRLSSEDTDKRNATDESESIQNQKSMLIEYAITKGWDIYKIYCDEDYSGADNTRPDWNSLIQDAESRKFDIVLCKTQSRFSRDMEMVERYIHGKFIEWHIRFISVVDNADTAVEGNKKSRQINGLVNEWYLEDVSNNVRRTLKHMKQKGEWTGSSAPYGYKRDPDNKNKLIVDEVAAKVVKDIFNMYTDGMGCNSITKYLNRTGIPNPGTYKLESGYGRVKCTDTATSSVWTHSSVHKILKREVYTGTLVQGMRETLSYKNKKQIPISEDKWIKVADTHEAIIDRELWESIQVKFVSRRRADSKSGTYHILAGKVFCSECDKVMWKTTNNHIEGKDYCYMRCRTASVTKGLCLNTGGLSFATLVETVRNEINSLLTDFYDPNVIALPKLQLNNVDELNDKLRQLNKSIEQKNSQIDEVYQDKLAKLVPEDVFVRNLNRLNSEIEDLQYHQTTIERELSQIQGEDESSEEDSRTKLLSQYEYIDELTHDVVEAFVKNIYISKKEKNEREVKIVWNF